MLKNRLRRKKQLGVAYVLYNFSKNENGKMTKKLMMKNTFLIK